MSGGSMWPEDKVQWLIELFKDKPVLWDIRHKDYRNRNKKMDAMREIAEIMDMELIEIERKLNILVTQFRRTHRKVLSSKKAGMGEDAERNIWYGYKALYFLGDRFDFNSSTSTVKNEMQEFSESSDNVVNESYQEELVLMKDQSDKSILFKDEYDLYGEQIALKLKKMDPLTRLETQHRINCILHEVEMNILHNMYDNVAATPQEKRFKGNSSKS